MLVVENIAEGNRAYCNLNEGIGKVMRFGCYGEDACSSACAGCAMLMPVLSAALKQMTRGIDLTAMMAQGITMGDGSTSAISHLRAADAHAGTASGATRPRQNRSPK